VSSRAIRIIAAHRSTIYTRLAKLIRLLPERELPFGC
jgi:hypothetical protein